MAKKVIMKSVLVLSAVAVALSSLISIKKNKTPGKIGKSLKVKEVKYLVSSRCPGGKNV